MDEMAQIDGTTEEQVWCLPVLRELMVRKAAVEEELHLLNNEKEKNVEGNCWRVPGHQDVSNKEVWDHVQDWAPSVRAEFEQLVNQKKAVRQMTRSQLQDLATEKGLPIELLPAKMLHTRKANSGAYRSRAVVCGNFQETSSEDRYAGGADGCQIRAMFRTAALLKCDF